MSEMQVKEIEINFAKLIYLGEFLSDQLESVTMQIESEAKKQGHYIRTEKMLINKAKKAISELAEIQRKTLGTDHIYDDFCSNSDFLMEVLKEAVFIPQKNRVKVLSSIKLLNK